MNKKEFIKHSIREMRVIHWLKNLLIFAPMIFSHNLFNAAKLLEVLVVAFSFSLLCSSVYIINDLFDIKEDRNNPVNKNRPIASGKLSVKTGKILSAFLFFAAIIWIGVISSKLLIFYLGYYLLNVFYSVAVKKRLVISVLFMPLFYLARVLIGAAAINVSVSGWLISLVILISFFVAATKKYYFSRISGSKINKSRWRIFIIFLELLMVGAYIFYLTTNLNRIYNSRNSVFFSVILVFLIFLKYTHLIEKARGPFERVLFNKILWLLIFAWVFFISGVMYGTNIIM